MLASAQAVLAMAQAVLASAQAVLAMAQAALALSMSCSTVEPHLSSLATAKAPSMLSHILLHKTQE